MVRLLDVDGDAAFGPFVENPLEAGGVTMQACLVDGEVAIVILGLEDLVCSASSDCIVVHFVE